MQIRSWRRSSTSRLMFIIIIFSDRTQRLQFRTLANEALADICGFIDPLCALKRPQQTRYLI